SVLGSSAFEPGVPDAPPATSEAATGIWASGPSDAYVVTGTRLLHSDGSGTWVTVSSPAEHPTAVYGSGPGDVYLAGTEPYRSSGQGEWKFMRRLSACTGCQSFVWAGSPNDVWAGGADVLAHFDGTAWTDEVRNYGIDGVPYDPQSRAIQLDDEESLYLT